MDELWDRVERLFRKARTEHTGSVYCSTVSVKYNLLITGSSDTTLKVWDMTTTKCLRTLRGHRVRVRNVLMATNSLICSASDDNIMKIWDIDSGACLDTIDIRKGSHNNLNRYIEERKHLTPRVCLYSLLSKGLCLPMSERWSRFLKRGLYDPRVWLQVAAFLD